MWGPIIEFLGKKDVNSSEKKLDFVDNDLDELFDNAIQKLDMEIDNLRQIKNIWYIWKKKLVNIKNLCNLQIIQIHIKMKKFYLKQEEN